MIEVFKTDVVDSRQAEMIIKNIEFNFSNYNVNFDLQDCDNILRVQCNSGMVAAGDIIQFLKGVGCNAVILPG